VLATKWSVSFNTVTNSLIEFLEEEWILLKLALPKVKGCNASPLRLFETSE
jgi:hypothetical protein